MLPTTMLPTYLPENATDDEIIAAMLNVQQKLELHKFDQPQVIVGNVDENNLRQGKHYTYSQRYNSASQLHDGKIYLQSIYPFTDNKLDGLAEFWHTNGEKAEEINFKDGKKHGISRAWDPDGMILREKNYDYGSSQGLDIRYYPVEKGEQPRKQSQKNFNDSEYHGTQTYWHANGQRSLEANHDNGKRHGVQKSWDEQGKLQTVELHQDHIQVADYKTSLRMIQFADSALALIGYKADRTAEQLADDQFKELQRRHSALRK